MKSETVGSKSSGSSGKGFYVKPFVSISIASGRNKDGTVQFKEQRFYSGDKMYYYLQGPYNQPGAPGHNPTTRVGVEIHKYQKENQ